MLHVGNNAVVCRCEVAGREYALKCYPRHRRNARAIYGDAYHEAELAVYTILGAVEYADVVAMPWVEGRTLDTLLGEPKMDYRSLSERFEAFALEILRGEGAHGDIKPENIVVTPDGDFRLIDFDSAWLPGFVQSDMEEAGTPTFSHPMREERRFDKSIDDFAIALIVTMLAALAYRSDDFTPYIDAEGSLFVPRDVVSGTDVMLNRALSVFERKGDRRHYAIAFALYDCNGSIPNLAELLDVSNVKY
jgi:serine/threonine protein kinase